MKIKITSFFALFFIATALAQTNFAILNCANASYTNATIVATNPVYLTIIHDAGGGRVYLTNLPAWLQSRYPYDPTNAANYLLAVKNKRFAQQAAFAAQNAEQQKILSALAKNKQIIHILKIGDDMPGGTVCETSAGTLQMVGLPDGVIAFVSSENAIRSQIDYLKNTPIRVTATVNDPNDSDPAYTSQMNAISALNAASESRDEKVRDLTQQLREIKKQESRRNAVSAYPSGQRYSYPIWNCIGIAYNSGNYDFEASP